VQHRAQRHGAELALAILTGLEALTKEANIGTGCQRSRLLGGSSSRGGGGGGNLGLYQGCARQKSDKGYGRGMPAHVPSPAVVRCLSSQSYFG
ncbi:MAG TPA: hypothetical protein PKD72_14475, partial [Gemmatales bacterium]|nr:hypothetical protein [Gemmatales bacterium]